MNADGSGESQLTSPSRGANERNVDGVMAFAREAKYLRLAPH
jgi:hypothetical protein